ncbi:MAG: FAD-binding oxidoreductase [Candidatus Buchananbacteria bacterium]|nr:FAD-binding oxidoreductase [Candidatus Buchananbacteria bacterium]
MAEAKVIWDRDVTPPTYPKLERDIEVDVAIIGAGITGLLVAYQLRIN